MAVERLDKVAIQLRSEVGQFGTRVGEFQINHEEPVEFAKARLSSCLERVIVAGLDQWRRTL